MNPFEDPRTPDQKYKDKSRMAGCALLLLLLAIVGAIVSVPEADPNDTPTTYYNCPKLDPNKEAVRWNWAENRPIYKEEYDSLQKARMRGKRKEVKPQETEPDLESMVEEAVDKYMD